MKALLAGVSLALLAGSTALHADDAKTVKLTINNGADRTIQVDVVDRATNQRTSAPDATPGGTAVSKATLKNDGTVDFMLSILYRGDASHGSYYRCLDVSTNPNGQSELSFDVTTDTGRTCSG